MHTLFRFTAIMMLVLCLQLTACATRPNASATNQLVLTCKTAADCTIKDVGNCCGYYPACVHKDQQVDPDAVQARCNKEGTASICGFPEISACACIEGQCAASGTGSSSGDPRIP